MDNFEYKIKNDQLGEIVQRVINNNFNLSEDTDKKTMGEELIVMFASDMAFNGFYKAGVSLDFDYDSLGNLAAAMRPNLDGYNEQNNNWEESLISLAKSLAAYLYCLGMNEHDAPFDIKVVRTALTPPDYNFNRPLWADCLDVKIGTKSKENFLDAAVKGVKIIDNGNERLGMIDVGPLIEAYESAFGIDLNDYNFTSFVTPIN